MNKLTSLSVAALLFTLGCTQKKVESQQKINSTISMSKLVNKENSYQINHQETNKVEYDLKYFFSNDSICNEMLIKTLNKSKKYEGIPEKIDFKLILTNKLTNSHVEINGIAELTSPNESFLDETEPDAGAYFAADYNKNNTGYPQLARASGSCL